MGLTWAVKGSRGWAVDLGFLIEGSGLRERGIILDVEYKGGKGNIPRPGLLYNRCGCRCYGRHDCCCIKI